LANTPDEAEFVALVAIGDRARRAGRIPEAATAYARAIKLRRDPLVLGRLGVLLVRMEQYAHAADLLYEALKLARTTRAERDEFYRAHEIARAHGAWIDVIISHAGSTVTVDGAPRNPHHLSAYTMFLLGGEHEIHASLEGYNDVWLRFIVNAAEDEKVTLTFDEPLPPALLATPPQPQPPPLSEPPMLPSSNVVGDPNYSAKDDPFYVSPEAKKAKETEELHGPHGSIFAGPVVVFGVASWMPAVGGVVGGAWRPNQYLSLGLEGRAAWLTVGVAGKPISAMTAGAVVSACGHLKWFFGCALGHAGIVRGEFSSGTFVAKSYVSPKIGGGGRIGAQVRLSQSFSLTGTVDALVMNSGVRVGLDGKVLVDQPPIMVGSQVVAGWEF
jgi:hypothetical protein